MKIPTYIQLLVITAIAALGCTAIGGMVSSFLNDTTATRLLVATLLFVPVFKVLLGWHRVVWEAQHAR